MGVKIGTFLLCALALTVSVRAKHSYNERCDVGVDEKNNNRTVDTCDDERFLTCRDSRCDCQDRANQIWTYQLVKVNSRTKRGSKSKGRIKTALAAGGAGLAGGYIGSKLAQGGSSSGSSFSGGRSSSNDKYQKFYSCYSRVNGQCVLPNHAANGDVLVQYHRPVELPGTTTTTTAAPASESPTNVNTTGGSSDTTTPASNTTAAPLPTPAAQTATYGLEVSRIPKCVPNAVCKRPEPKIVNGKVVSSVSSDPRLGVCECLPGYKANNEDACVKAGAGRLSNFGLFVLVLSTLFSVSVK